MCSSWVELAQVSYRPRPIIRQSAGARVISDGWLGSSYGVYVISDDFVSASCNEIVKIKVNVTQLYVSCQECARTRQNFNQICNIFAYPVAHLRSLTVFFVCSLTLTGATKNATAENVTVSTAIK